MERVLRTIINTNNVAVAEKLLEDHGPSPGEGFISVGQKGEFIWTVNPVWVAKLHASQKNRKSPFLSPKSERSCLVKQSQIVRRVENIKI